VGGSYINNDFALCKLDKPIDVEELQAPAKQKKPKNKATQTAVFVEINEEASVPSLGEDLIVMGLGLLSYRGKAPGYLRDLTLPYLGSETCNGTDSYNGRIKDAMFCAGFFEGGKDSCQGDSGSPIVKRTVAEDGTVTDVHVGIVSWGDKCAGENKPGVYARTSKRADWIKNTICNEFKSIASFCDNPLNITPPDSACDDQALIIKLETDKFGSETNWTLTDSNDTLVQKRRYFVDNYESNHHLCLKTDECYTWEILDEFGDGLCGTGKCGFYSFTLNGKEIISSDGDFEFRKAETFCTPSTKNPTIAPSESPSQVPTTSCQDNDEFRWKGKPELDCETYLSNRSKNSKASSKIKKKCKKQWDKIQVYEWCPKTCGEKAGLGPCASS